MTNQEDYYYYVQDYYELLLILGVGLSYSGTGLLENNTFITADSNGMIGDIHCSSDSSVANMGQWIAPSGADITNSTTDPYDVTVGNEQDPGSLVIRQRNGHLVTRSFQGIYTCSIDTADGEQNYLHVGIYPNGFNGRHTSCAVNSL